VPLAVNDVIDRSVPSKAPNMVSGQELHPVTAVDMVNWGNELPAEPYQGSLAGRWRSPEPRADSVRPSLRHPMN